MNRVTYNFAILSRRPPLYQTLDYENAEIPKEYMAFYIVGICLVLVTCLAIAIDDKAPQKAKKMLLR